MYDIELIYPERMEYQRHTCARVSTHREAFRLTTWSKYMPGMTISWLGLPTMTFDTHVEAMVALGRGKESITFSIPPVHTKT